LLFIPINIPQAHHLNKAYQIRVFAWVPLSLVS